jgi:hypothetical protein
MLHDMLNKAVVASSISDRKTLSVPDKTRVSLWGYDTIHPVYNFSSHDLERVEIGADGIATIPYNHDLIGDVFLHLQWRDPPTGNSDILSAEPFNLIKSIKYTVGGQVIESYDGNALLALRTFDSRAEHSIDGHDIVFPLRLCTSAHPHVYIPMACLKYHTPKIQVKVDTNQVTGMWLMVKGITLGHDERNQLVGESHKLNVTRKFSTSYEIAPSPVAVAIVDIDVPDWCDVRDLAVICKTKIKTIAVQICDRDSTKFVTRFQFDRVYTTKVIPKDIYKIDPYIAKWNNHVHLIPFDHTPLALEPSAFANFYKMRLLIEFDDMVSQKSNIVVHVMTRSASLLETQSGMLNIKGCPR